MNLKDKVVLVTGSSGGIGAATAIQFAKEGAHVVIVGRNSKKLQNVTKKFEEIGATPLVVKADVTKDCDGLRIIYETIAKYGRLDVLVNNAGIIDRVDILSDDFMDGYDRIMNVNLRALVSITHRAVPHLIKSKGNIINISSIAGIRTRGVSNLIPYCVSKAALNHFTRSLAMNLAGYGVRVNTVSPGPVRTDILSSAESMKDVSWEQYEDKTPLKRVSEPEEIADLIVLLASDKSRGITGSDFLTDNGAAVLS